MKIALCLYGHLRTFEYCYKSLRNNIIDLYDCDVFMHTWSTTECSTASWHDDKAKNSSSIELTNKLISYYKLKDILIENQENKENEYGYFHPVDFPDKNVSIWGVHCLWHSISQVNKLREDWQNKNNVKYNFVIFTRPDILFNNKFDLNKHLKNLDQKQIGKSFFCCADLLFGKQTPRINDGQYFSGIDLFFFSRPEIISDLIKNKNYILDKFKKDETIYRVTESLILELIQKLGYDYWIASYINFGYGQPEFNIIRQSYLDELKNKNKIRKHLEKHKKLLTNNLKSALNIPRELFSFIFYLLFNENKNKKL